MPSLMEKAARIEMLVLDVDGVLTDGGLYYTAEGQSMKRFDVQDGLGMKMAQQAGLKLAVITGLDSPAVAQRVEDLGIEDYHAGHLKKVPLLDSIRRKHGLDYEQMAYLGDDWVDIGPLKVVGLPMAVTNAVDEVRELAAWISTRHGGHGAVREAIMFILKARGQLDELRNQWSG